MSIAEKGQTIQSVSHARRYDCTLSSSENVQTEKKHSTELSIYYIKIYTILITFSAFKIVI